MATEYFGPTEGDEPPERPTERLPRLDRRCLACDGVMVPLAYWTGSPDNEWGYLRFGPQHPRDVRMPQPPMSQSVSWDRTRGASLSPTPSWPLDMAAEVMVETLACADCGRLDWYVVGPRPGHEGGMR
jgi:hypothetical protein